MAAPNASSSRTSRDEFWNPILGYPSAPAALEALKTAGLDEYDLAVWLYVIAELEKRLDRPQRELRDVRIAGVPLWQFDRYPGQLRNWAKKIRKLNDGLRADRFSRPASEILEKAGFPWRGGTPRQRQKVREAYKLLPLVLNAYASHLEIIAGIYRDTHGVFKRQLGGLRDAFAFWVYKKTGHRYYSQLATLLSAAFYALGLEDEKHVVNEHSLREGQRRSRVVSSLRKDADPVAGAEELRDLVLRPPDG